MWYAFSISAFDSKFPFYYFFFLRLVAMNTTHSHCFECCYITFYSYADLIPYISKHFHINTQLTRTRIYFCQYLFFLLDQKRSRIYIQVMNFIHCIEFFPPLPLLGNWWMSRRKRGKNVEWNAVWHMQDMHNWAYLRTLWLAMVKFMRCSVSCIVCTKVKSVHLFMIQWIK